MLHMDLCVSMYVCMYGYIFIYRVIRHFRADGSTAARQQKKNVAVKNKRPHQFQDYEIKYDFRQDTRLFEKDLYQNIFIHTNTHRHTHICP